MITVNTQHLHLAVTRCLMAQSKMRTPVSGFCKISKPTGDMVLQSFTERLNIETRVRAEGDMEPVLVNMSQLGGILAVETSPECKLSLDNALLKVQVGASVAHLNTMPVSEFPNLKAPALTTSLGDAKSIATAINKVVWGCIGVNGYGWEDDVHLEPGLAIAAVRARVIKTECDCLDELSIGSESARLLAAMVSDCDSAKMYMDKSSGWVSACSSDWSINVKSSEFQFASWRNVMNLCPERSVKIQTSWLSDMDSASNAIGGASGDLNVRQVQINMKGGWMGATIPGSGGNVWQREYEVDGVLEQASVVLNLKLLRGALRFLGESCEFFPGETMSFFRNGDFQLAVGHMAKV